MMYEPKQGVRQEIQRAELRGQYQGTSLATSLK